MNRRAAGGSLPLWAPPLLLLSLLAHRAAAQSQAWIYATDQDEMVRMCEGFKTELWMAHSALPHSPSNTHDRRQKILQYNPWTQAPREVVYMLPREWLGGMINAAAFDTVHNTLIFCHDPPGGPNATNPAYPGGLYALQMQGLELSYVSDYALAGFDPSFGCDYSATFSPGPGEDFGSYFFPWSSTRFQQTLLQYQNPPPPGKGIYQVVSTHRYRLNGGGNKNSGGDIAIDPIRKKIYNTPQSGSFFIIDVAPVIYNPGAVTSINQTTVQLDQNPRLQNSFDCEFETLYGISGSNKWYVRMPTD